HLGPQHGVPEAERVALAHVVHVGEVGRVVDLLQLLVVALHLEHRLSSPARSKWFSRAVLLRPVTMSTSVRPAATASSTTYWMAGLSTTGSISFGMAFVAGRNRVPSPAAGMTAFVMEMGDAMPARLSTQPEIIGRVSYNRSHVGSPGEPQARPARRTPG